MIHFILLDAPFLHPFRQVLFNYQCCYAFWSTFGTLWVPFVSILFPFGCLWAPFGSYLVPFGSRLLTPGVYFLILGSPRVIFYILLYFQRKSYRRQGFSCKLFIARWRDCGFAALKITTPRPRTSKDRQEPTQNKAHKRRSKTQNTTRHSI